MSRLLACAIVCLWGGPLFAQSLWQVDSTRAKPDVGTQLTLGEKFAVGLKEPSASIPAGELVAIRQLNLAKPARPLGPVLMLANGDCFPGTLISGKALSLEWNWRVGDQRFVKLTVPLPAVRAVWFAPPPNPDDDPAEYDWFANAKKQDTIRLRNGDVLKGAFENFSADGLSLRFRSAGEATAKPVDCQTVAAVVFDPSLSRVKVPKAAYVKIVTRNSSRLSASAATCEGKDLSVTLLAGGSVALPLSEVVSLDVLGGKAAYLGDLVPKSATTEPFNRVAWEWKPNRTVKGNPLYLLSTNGEDTFDRGLGTHSKTTLAYDLAGMYRFFEASVGLDARTGKKGHAAVSVLVDDTPQPLPQLASLKFGNATRVRIEVTKAKTLTLAVDFGSGGDVQDDVNWGDARLIE